MLASDLESTGHDPLKAFDDGIVKRPTQARPSIVASIHDARASIELNSADREAMLDAMRIGAERRVESILGRSRRRHYGHAATLVASCLWCAPRDLEQAISEWILGLRQRSFR